MKRLPADPDRNTLIAFLNSAHAIYSGDADSRETDVECAAYWVAADCHSGQGSRLYTALSQSPYTPGPLENAPDGMAETLYIDALTAMGFEWSIKE